MPHKFCTSYMMECRNFLILSLGSNVSPEFHIAFARRRLEELFPGIHYSEAVYTQPVDCPASGLFLNCVAKATTSYTLENVHAMLKDLEEEAGRTSDGKSSGVVPLDIDILEWNGIILKPADMQRSYVMEGLHSLIHES